MLELFNRASALAEAALCTHKSEDLELAFAGEARGAFLCLQCFVDEEEDWCRTRGCPGTSAIFSSICPILTRHSLYHICNPEHRVPPPPHNRRIAPLNILSRNTSHVTINLRRAIDVSRSPSSAPHSPRPPRCSFLRSLLGPGPLAVPPLARHATLRRHPSPDRRMREPRISRVITRRRPHCFYRRQAQLHDPWSATHERPV